MLEALAISFAFGLGLLGRAMGLPPLVGYLAAGFALNAAGPALGLPKEASSVLSHIAHLGVLLLLFTVGLKLRVRSLIQPEVLGGGLAHFALICVLLAPLLHLLLDLPWNTALLLAVALAFSSTVLAAKTLEAKRELTAFHGRVAIGILIVQDLLALAVMTFTGGHAPSLWALVLLGLPLLRPALFRLLDRTGHDELLVLLGMLLALALGGALFEGVGLSGELGALVAGVLLSGHPRATELSNALWSLKEVFLVGFFLQIGMEGLPDWGALAFAALLCLLLPLKGLLFYLLLVVFRLRARNAFLAGLSLTSYSEFGLIVAAVALPEWLVPLALAVALSFVVAAPLNRFAHPLFERLEVRLQGLQRAERHPDEQLLTVGDAEVLVMGMGRVGTAAYDALREDGLRILGLDSDPARVQRHCERGRHVVYADAEDSSFWHGPDFGQVRSVVLCMSGTEAQTFAARQLRALGFDGLIIAHAMYDDVARAIEAAGADRTYLTMSEAGAGLANHLRELRRHGEGAAEQS